MLFSKLHWFCYNRRIKCLLPYSLLDCCLYLEVNECLKEIGNRYLSSLLVLHEMPNLGIDEVFSVEVCSCICDLLCDL